MKIKIKDKEGNFHEAEVIQVYDDGITLNWGGEDITIMWDEVIIQMN